MENEKIENEEIEDVYFSVDESILNNNKSSFYINTGYELKKNEVRVSYTNDALSWYLPREFLKLDWRHKEDVPCSMMINDTGIYISQNICEYIVDNDRMKIIGQYQIHRYDFNGVEVNSYKVDYPVNNALVKGNILIYSKVNEKDEFKIEL
jgi:hypothetical protein